MSSVLRVGAMTSKDLVTRFRHLLKTDEVSDPQEENMGSRSVWFVAHDTAIPGCGGGPSGERRSEARWT